MNWHLMLEAQGVHLPPVAWQCTHAADHDPTDTRGQINRSKHAHVPTQRQWTLNFGKFKKRRKASGH